MPEQVLANHTLMYGALIGTNTVISNSKNVDYWKCHLPIHACSTPKRSSVSHVGILWKISWAIFYKALGIIVCSITIIFTIIGNRFQGGGALATNLCLLQSHINSLMLKNSYRNRCLD